MLHFKDWIEGDLVLGFLVDGFLTRHTIFLAVNFFVLESAPPFIETLVRLFGLLHFEDWIEGDLVLGFSIDGFLTKLVIFSSIIFFILWSAPPFIETLVTLFGLLHFEDWIEGNLVLGFPIDGFLARLAIFFCYQFLCTREYSFFYRNLSNTLWFGAF